MDDIIQQGSDAAGAAGGSRGGMTEGTGMESVEGTEAATPVPEDSKPRQRTRQTLVCGECKRLKLKCDRRMPCDQCVKRETLHKCVYQQNAADRIDVHSLNNRMKDNERRQKEEYDVMREQLSVLQEEMRGAKEREREREREMARMRDGFLPFAFQMGALGPGHGRIVNSSSSSSAQHLHASTDFGRHRFRHQDRVPHVGMSPGTTAEPARDIDASASYRKARAALVIPGHSVDDEGVVFAGRLRAVAIDSTLAGEIGDSPDLGLSKLGIGSEEDEEDEEPPCVRYPELAAMFISPSATASTPTTHDQIPRHTHRPHYRITPHLVSTLPSPPTRNFLFSKLKDALTSTAAGVGIYNRVFEKRVKSIWERIGRVGDGGVGTEVRGPGRTKGREKGKGRSGDDAVMHEGGGGEGGNAKESGKKKEKNVTLAQFALAVAALGVAVKWVWVVQGGKICSDANPSQSDSDFPAIAINATLAATLYNQADTALTLQSDVERNSFDSVLALVLQGLSLGMTTTTHETRTGGISRTRSDTMMKRVLNDALDRAMGIGLQFDPWEIVVRRVGDNDSEGLAAGVPAVMSEGMAEGPRKRRRGDEEDAAIKEEGSGHGYGSAGMWKEKGKEREREGASASASTSTETRAREKASKSGRSGNDNRLTPREGEIRRRAWWSLVILDQTHAFLTDTPPLIKRDSFSTCLPYVSASASTVAGTHQARLPQPSISSSSSPTSTQPTVPPPSLPPSSSVSSSRNASYVAFGDTRRVLKSDFSFTISSVPPSEPTSRSDAGTGTVERNEYFVVRCRFAQMALDVLQRVRKIELDALHAAPDPEAVSEFTTDVARETSRLLEELPEDLQLSIFATVSNSEPIRLELSGENVGRDADVEAALISRRCDLVIAARRVLLSSCWPLLSISNANASGVPGDTPGVPASVLSLFERSTHETIFATRTLLALGAHLKDKMSKLVVFSRRELEKAVCEAGMKAATVASLCDADSGGNATRAMINARAALRALTHPALSLAPGKINTTARLLESHIFTMDAKINKPRRKGVDTSMTTVMATTVKRKRTRLEMDADGELVDRRTHGDEFADDAVGTLPLKRPLIPSMTTTVSATGDDNVSPVEPTTVIVDTSRVEEREGVSTPAAPIAATPAQSIDAPIEMTSSRITRSQKKVNYLGDDHPKSRLAQIPHDVGSSSTGNSSVGGSKPWYVRQRGSEGKVVRPSRREKERKDSSSRSNARGDQAQPSSSQLPSRGMSHSSLSPMDTTGLPRHWNTVAPTSPLSNTPARQTSDLTDPASMLHTPQAGTPVPTPSSTFFGVPTTPVQPLLQTPMERQYFPPNQSFDRPYHTPVHPPPSGNQLEFLPQVHSSPMYTSVPPAQTSRSHSSQSHRPSFSSTGTATPMELVPPQVTFPSNAGAMPFEIPLPLQHNPPSGPPPMSSLQPDPANMHHQPQYRYAEHAMQFTSPHRSFDSAGGADLALHHAQTHPHPHSTMMNQLPPNPQQQEYLNMDQNYSVSPTTNQQPSWPSDNFDPGYGSGWRQ